MFRFHIFFLLAPIFLSGQNFERLSDFPGPARDDAVAEYANGKIYAGTGYGTGFIPLADWWCFDPQTMHWNQLADFPGSARQHLASAVVQDFIYLIGGWQTDSVYFGDVWQFSTKTQRWTKKLDFPGGKRWAASAVGFQNKIYLGGGKDSNQVFQDWWEFDPVKNQWRELPAFPGGQRSLAIAEVIGNQIVFGMGWDDNQNPKDDFWFYKPSLNRWSNSNLHFSEALAHPSVCARGQKLYLTGGEKPDGTFNFSYFEIDFQSEKITKNQDASFRQGRGSNLIMTENCEQFLLWGYDSAEVRVNDFWKISLTGDVSILQAPEIQPNPTSTMLKVHLPENWENLQVLNSNGRLIEEIAGGKCEQKIDVSNYKSGMYFLRYSLENQISDATRFAIGN